MRRFLLLIVLTLSFSAEADAQLNKAYFFHIGRRFIINDQFQDAIETLNVLLKVDPESYEGYFLRAIAKHNLDDLLGAEQDFSRAIETNPVFTTAYLYRAITRSRLGNYDDALKDFREAIDLRPDLPESYFKRGLTYMFSQQPEQAIADFTEYLRRDNRSPDAYLARGESYLMTKDTLSAMNDFEQAIRINRDRPDSYYRRGTVYLQQQKYDAALEDFNRAIACDSTYLPAYFNRGRLYALTTRPVQAIADFTRAVALDSTNSLIYFNRALLRTEIGDYNRALEDYHRMERYSPNNVLLYYNRASLYARLGDLHAAIADYGRAIELYPDFANAYLARADLRDFIDDPAGARQDRGEAQRKIAEYRSKLNEETFSAYADTSKRFNQLLSFETMAATTGDSRLPTTGAELNLLPMFKFSLMQPDSSTVVSLNPYRYFVQEEADFRQAVDEPLLKLVNRPTDLAPETLFAMDRALEDSLRYSLESWPLLFKRAVTQSLVRQYTSSIASYTTAIDRAPVNPFLYMNRGTTQSEMIDFISSIDNSYQSMNMSLPGDPANRLKGGQTRIYNYDEAIGDMNKAIKLLPDFAYFYFNRANLYCRSGMIPEAIEDYARAIELHPSFGEAYFNRGIVQIFIKDTQAGYLDISKAGELGIREAYEVLRNYANGN